MRLLAQVELLPVVFGIAVLVGIVLAGYGLYRGYEYLARRSLKRKYADLPSHGKPQPGDVILIYHTYHGLLVWFTQTPHYVALPPDDARRLLGRLLRFNLMWGLVTYGALFIPPLAIYNYLAQRRSISKQEAAGAFELAETTSDDVATLPVVESSRGGNVVVGWVLAGLSLMFGISTVNLALKQEFGTACVGAFMTLVLASQAREFIGKKL